MAKSETPQPARGQGSSLQTLMRYMQWANHVFYQSCAELPEDTLITNRAMLFDNILNLLNHVYSMALAWQAHLQGREHSLTTRRPVNDIDFTELWRRQAELDAWYVNYAEGLHTGQQDEMLIFEFIGGGVGTMTRGEMLNHVLNHASYHRGHIEGVFYQLGIEPPTTDLPVFLRLCAESG